MNTSDRFFRSLTFKKTTEKHTADYKISLIFYGKIWSIPVYEAATGSRQSFPVEDILGYVDWGGRADLLHQGVSLLKAVQSHPEVSILHCQCARIDDKSLTRSQSIKSTSKSTATSCPHSTCCNVRTRRWRTHLQISYSYPRCIMSNQYKGIVK